MTIDWNVFTPWSAAIGGVVIGIAAALLVLVNGRVAGISGIVGGMFVPRAGDFAWLTLSGLLNVRPLSRETTAQISYDPSA